MYKDLPELVNITEEKDILINKKSIKAINDLFKSHTLPYDRRCFNCPYYVVALLGPSGSGKITSLRFLAKQAGFLNEINLWDIQAKIEAEEDSKAYSDPTSKGPKAIRFTKTKIFTRVLEEASSRRRNTLKEYYVLCDLPNDANAKVRPKIWSFWRNNSQIFRNPPKPIFLILNDSLYTENSIKRVFQSESFKRVQVVKSGTPSATKLKKIAKTLKSNFRLIRRLKGFPRLDHYFRSVRNPMEQLKDQYKACRGDVRLLLNFMLQEGYKAVSGQVRLGRTLSSVSDRVRASQESHGGGLEGNHKDLKKSIFQRLGRVLYGRDGEDRQDLLGMVKSQSNCMHGQKTFRDVLHENWLDFCGDEDDFDLEDVNRLCRVSNAACLSHLRENGLYEIRSLTLQEQENELITYSLAYHIIQRPQKRQKTKFHAITWPKRPEPPEFANELKLRENRTLIREIGYPLFKKIKSDQKRQEKLEKEEQRRKELEELDDDIEDIEEPYGASNPALGHLHNIPEESYEPQNPKIGLKQLKSGFTFRATTDDLELSRHRQEPFNDELGRELELFAQSQAGNQQFVFKKPKNKNFEIIKDDVSKHKTNPLDDSLLQDLDEFTQSHLNMAESVSVGLNSPKFGSKPSPGIKSHSIGFHGIRRHDEPSEAEINALMEDFDQEYSKKSQICQNDKKC